MGVNPLDSNTGGESGAAYVFVRRGTTARRLGETVKGELDWIVLKALDKDRERRYGSANALAEDLQHYLRNEPVLASPPGHGYRLRKFLRRHKGSVAATTAVITALAAGAVVSALQAKRAMEAEAGAKRSEHDAIFERNQSRLSERKAIEQSEIASEVSSFLTEGVLKQGSGTEQADAGFEPTPHLTVHEAVIRAAKKIEGKFEGKPAVEAAVRDAISDALWGLGEWKDELPHRTRALELREAMPQPDPAEVARSLNNLSRVLADFGQTSKAFEAQQRAVAMWQSALGPLAQATLLGRSNMAEMKAREHDFEGALADFEAVLQDQKKAFPKGHPYILQTLNNYSQSCFQTGKVAKALELQHEAEEQAAAMLGDNHPTTLSIRQNLAMVLRMTGSPKEAIPIFEKALATARKNLRPGHPTTLGLMDGLAWALDETGKEEESLKLNKEAADLAAANLGEKHSLTQSAVLNYASSLARGAEAGSEAAVPILERLIENVGRGYGNEDLRVPLLSRWNLSRIYRRLGRPKDTVRVLTEALEIAGAKLGAEHSETLDIAENLAEAQEEAGDPAAARKTLKDMLGDVEKGTDAWLRLAPKLCASHEADGDFLAAESPRLEHYALLHKAHTENLDDEKTTTRWVQSVASAFKNQLALQKPAEAERIVREAIAAKTGKAAVPLFMFRQFLGKALLAEEKYGEAETELLSASAGLEEYRKKSDDPGAVPAVAKAIESSLTALYEKWGPPEKKAAWQNQLSEKRAAAFAQVETLIATDDADGDRVVTALTAQPETDALKLVALLVERPLLDRLNALQLLSCVRRLPQDEIPLKRRLFARMAAREFAPEERNSRDMGFAYGAYLEACAGDKEACHRIFRAGLDKYPEAPRLHRYKGLAILVLGDAKAALAAFAELSKRLTGDPNPADLPLLLSGPITAHWLEGNKDRAVELCRRLIAANPAFANADQAAAFNPVEPCRLPPPNLQPFAEAIRETLQRYPKLKPMPKTAPAGNERTKNLEP